MKYSNTTCARYGHVWSPSILREAVFCVRCGEPRNTHNEDAHDVNRAITALTNADNELVQTWVHPIFGSPFRVNGLYRASRRERWFGRRSELKGEFLNAKAFW